jgi:hypothetical protein
MQIAITRRPWVDRFFAFAPCFPWGICQEEAMESNEFAVHCGYEPSELVAAEIIEMSFDAVPGDLLAPLVWTIVLFLRREIVSAGKGFAYCRVCDRRFDAELRGHLPDCVAARSMRNLIEIRKKQIQAKEKSAGMTAGAPPVEGPADVANHVLEGRWILRKLGSEVVVIPAALPTGSDLARENRVSTFSFDVARRIVQSLNLLQGVSNLAISAGQVQILDASKSSGRGVEAPFDQNGGAR